MAEVIIIDDDEILCKTLSRYIKRAGHNAVYALTLGEGLKKISSHSFDLAFLDVRLPDGNGLDALPEIRESYNPPEVIIITGIGDPDGAELAVKSGVWAYIEKPPGMENLELQVSRALQYRKEKENARIIRTLKRGRIIGGSPQLETCLDRVAQVAGSDASVLITGETGTGKELLAKTIHDNSLRSEKNFVVVDCTVLPESLVESILFGHEKGAFTGAEKDRLGLIREADGGTLFLDEVGELPLSLQKDFLRVLQEKRVRPLGSVKEMKVDFRCISATNRDLEKMVESGQFRKDLFYRLQSFIIEIPPLRDRQQDIKDLALHCMNNLCEKQGIETKGFSSDFFEALYVYNWPGNVRELIHVMESLLIAARFEPTLFARHLPTNIRVHQARASFGKMSGSVDQKTENNRPSPSLLKLQEVREAALTKAEKQYLQDLLSLTKKNMKDAARISGLSQSHLYHLLKKYDITSS